MAVNVSRGRSSESPESGGFTLIEVLLAVALSALLLTIVYGTYFSINRSIVAATEDEDAFDTGRTLSELIKKDIRAMSVEKYPFIVKNVVVDGRQFGQMEFVTNALSPEDPQRLRRVGYALVLSDKGEKVFVRKESKDLSTPLDTFRVDNPPQIYEISRIITGFLVELYNGSQWVQVWDSGSGGTVPAQIRVTIDVADARGKNRKFIAEEAIQATGMAEGAAQGSGRGMAGGTTQGAGTGLGEETTQGSGSGITGGTTQGAGNGITEGATQSATTGQ